MGRRAVVPVVVLLGLLSGDPPLRAQSPEDLAVGERIFFAQCARCHGVGGTGGEGPALQGRRFRTVLEQEDIVGVITDGLGGMPGMWIGEAEALQIAAYVWSLARVIAEPVPGDPVAGRAVFEGRGICATCHIVEGRGVGLGPELTDVGSRRGAEFLRQALLAPGAELPKGQISPHASFLLVNATQREGDSLVGMRIWEDAFVIQIRDAAGAYHAVDKADLASLERRFGASLMPEYSELLSDTEVTDLVAYLSSLKGNR